MCRPEALSVQHQLMVQNPATPKGMGQNGKTSDREPVENGPAFGSNPLIRGSFFNRPFISERKDGENSL
jgi:hypothetical protein